MADDLRIIHGVWDDGWTPPRHPAEERLAFAARTGTPITIEIESAGVLYVGPMKVTDAGGGNYQCAPVGPLRRRWVPVVRLDPRRLPE